MAAKTVSYQQQPIIATDILQVNHIRQSGATDLRVEATYQIRDETGVIRGRGLWVGSIANYPMTGAAVLAGCNAQEGT